MEDALNTAPCGFLRLADDGTVLLVNATLLKSLGLERGALEGKRVDTILAPGARIFYQTHVFPLLKMHGEIEEVYLSLRSANGADLPVLLNAVRREHEGSMVNDCMTMVMRRRSQLEDELLQAKNVAEEASQAKARFLSMMSHDLRAPLSGISMAAEILANGGESSVTDRQRHDLERIQEASQYVLRLLTDILNFSRLESGRVDIRPRAVSLEEVLVRTETMVKHLMKKAELTFVRENCAPEITVFADADRIQQVLLNLLTNAVKFTEPGGRIALVCERVGDRMCLHVRDTGRGIPEDSHDAIFDPFTKIGKAGGATGREQEGVGLGLSISRELARAMGGELTVESTVGEGSTFTLSLPLAEAHRQ